jgi:hypothetical protein
MRLVDADALKKDIELQTNILLAIEVDPKLTQIAKIMKTGFIAQIDKMPTVEPERKTGHWIDRSDNGRIVFPWWDAYSCDECGGHGTAWWSFCPHCGAKMEGAEE